MSSVVAYRELKQLDQLRLAWNVLLGETEDATFFQTLEWYQFALSRLRPSWRPMVLVVESLGKPIGILPLCVVDSKTRWGVQRKLVSPPATSGASFRPIGKQVTATMVAAARFLRQHPRWWDVAEWSGIESQGWDRGRTEDAFANAGLRWVPTRQQIIVREGLIEEEFASPSARSGNQGLCAARSHVRTGRANSWRTIELRPVATRFGDGDPQWETFDRWTRETSWDQLAVHVPSDLEPHAFLEHVHAFASDRGVGKLIVVTHHGEAMGFQYQLIWDGAIMTVAEGEQTDSSGKRNPVFAQVIQQEIRESGRRDGDRWFEFPIETSRSMKPQQEMIVRQSYRGLSRQGWSQMWRWLKSG